MKGELLIKDEARLEIIDAYLYYENARTGLGELFLDNLNHSFNEILLSPLQYPIKRSPYREAKIKKFPYLIIYESIVNKIFVYSVFNTWRDPKRKP